MIKKIFRNPFNQTFFLCIAAGCIFSLLKFSMQTSTEVGMYHNGLLTFGENAPYEYYFMRIFSFLNFWSTFIIRLTDSAYVADLLTGVLVHCVVLSALGLGCFALCRKVIFSVLAAMLLVDYGLFYGGSPVYPLLNLNGEGTYGCLGQAFLALALVLAGCGKFSLSAFCAGLMGVIHPTWSIFAFSVFVFTGIFCFRMIRHICLKYILFFLAGFLISCIFFGIQIYWMRHIPSMSEEAADLMRSYLEKWSDHHQKISLSDKKIWSAVIAELGIAAAGIYFFFKRKEKILLLTCFGGAALLGAAGILCTHDVIPARYAALMPGRFCNLAAFMLPSLTLGLLFSAGISKKYMIVVNLVLCAYLVFPSLYHSYRPSRRSLHELQCRIPPFWKTVSKDEGMLLSGIKQKYLLRLAGRGVWTDIKILNCYPMVPEVFPILEKGMQELYGVSLKQKNMAGRKSYNGEIPSVLFQQLWEKRTVQQWEHLARKYSFTGILVPASWHLNLKQICRNEDFAYYRVRQLAD